MKIYITGKGIQVLPTKETEALKARQSSTAPRLDCRWREINY